MQKAGTESTKQSDGRTDNNVYHAHSGEAAQRPGLCTQHLSFCAPFEQVSKPIGAKASCGACSNNPSPFATRQTRVVYSIELLIIYLQNLNLKKKI